jgi:hypothetical protein
MRKREGKEVRAGAVLEETVVGAAMGKKGGATGG